jgi:Fe-S-cluster containining protein
MSNADASKPSTPDWEGVLGIPKPSCCNLKAACCAVSTPSVPAKDLLAMAAAGDETARDFLNVFIPHANHAAAKAFYPEDPSHIDRVLEMVLARNTSVALTPEEVVFFHCRYLDEERRCQVYEDRPQFCRSYPASPMAITVKGCGYNSWKQACASKLKDLGYEIVGFEGEV